MMDTVQFTESTKNYQQLEAVRTGLTIFTSTIIKYTCTEHPVNYYTYISIKCISYTKCKSKSQIRQKMNSVDSTY